MNASGKTFAPAIVWDPEVEAYLRGALGDERFERTAAALSRPPRTTCMRVNTLRTSAQEVVTRVLQQLGPGWDPDVVQIHPQVPCAVILRGSGPHEVSYEAAASREVIISRKAGEAVLRGAPVFVPGVLAASSGVARGDLVALAVAREKPGSDTPEITRGTTLYTAAAAPPAAPAATAADAAPANDSTSAACRAFAPSTLADVDADTLPAPAGADATAGMPDGNIANRDNGETGSGQQQPGRHGRKRGRHVKDAAAAGGTPSQAPVCADAAVVVLGREGEGGVTASSRCIDSGCGGASEAEQPAPLPTGPCPLVDPQPGWTPSSQGPLAPRTGMYVGLARAAMSRQEMFRAREGVALELVEPVFRVPPAVGGLPPGWVMLQNLPSLMAALALAPAPGCRVLDMCAAPGGKSTLLAQIMGDQGEIVAFDRTHSKAQEILSLAKELGVTCITARKMDAGKALERPAGHNSNDRNRSGPPPSESVRPVEPRTTEALSVRTGATAPCTANGQPTRGSVHGNDADDFADGGVGGDDGDIGANGIRSVCADGGGVSGTGGGTGSTDGVPPDAQPAAPSAHPGGGLGAGGAAPPGQPPMSEKARLREERRRAAMLRRGITPPQPRDASLTSTGPAAYPAESFDHVLLDAPCSALGLRPRLQQQARALYLRQCAAAQRRLMDAAVRLLRVGGNLVYSTCTINPGENEACVRYLLDRYGSSFKLVPAGPPFLGAPGLSGRHPTMEEAGRPICGQAAAAAVLSTAGGAASGASEGSGGEPVTAVGEAAMTVVSEHGEEWLTEAEAALVQRFDPADADLDTIGFFVAKFVKIAPVAT